LIENDLAGCLGPPWLGLEEDEGRLCSTPWQLRVLGRAPLPSVAPHVALGFYFFNWFGEDAWKGRGCL